MALPALCRAALGRGRFDAAASHVLDRGGWASATTALAGTVLANAIGIAVAGAEVFGVSMALGAFLADERRLERIAHQPHDCMLLDPCALLSAPAMVIATLAVILLGKPWAPDLCHLPMAHGVPVYLRHSR
jgi:predicted Kef-type K+ transport protein